MEAPNVEVDPLVQSFIVNGTKNLIVQIQNDIDQETDLSDRTYKTCSSILEKASKEYDRIRVAFVEDTKILLEKGRQQPVPQQRKNFHKPWMHALKIHTAACEQLIGPITQVLDSVSIESVRLRRKYRLLIFGASGCSLIVVGLVAVLFIDFCPAIPVSLLTAAGFIGVFSALALAVALLIQCITGAMCVKQIRAIYDRCTSQLKALMTKFMPNIFGKNKNTVTAKDLQNAIKEALDAFKIEEESWEDLETLEMLVRQCDRVLDALREKAWTMSKLFLIDRVWLWVPFLSIASHSA